MKVSGRNVLLVAVGLLVAAVVAGWWLYNYEYVETEVDLPPRGEARYNPLYALRLALQAAGVEATSRQRLQLDEVPLGVHDTVLVLSDPRTLSPEDVDGLLAWVEGGGHLLVRTPPLERGDATRAGALLDALQLRLLSSRECTRFAAQADDDDGEKSSSGWYAFCARTRFAMLGVEPLQSWGDLDKGYVYARLAHGSGTVDVLADLGFLTNGALEQPGPTALARQLLQPGWKRGTVHLVYAANMPSLWRLLLETAWMAWLPALLTLAAWLWMRTQRFGPPLPSPEPARRALLEHVQASGEHLWRYGRASVLHAAVREVFMARLRRRDPLAAALDGRAQAEAIAHRTGATVADIEHALQVPRPRDGADFRQRIARLLQLRQQL
ncbi:DUF4350 domain-containing protein [Luteimonas soli]|uniref:DUF4350 domain-containing protein n=1 Tax=Luteimonas soli TaxID=1648966 RepID=A0ABV7XJ05_9GAMM